MSRPAFVTERLELWRPTAADIEPMFAIASHPETARHLAAHRGFADHFERFCRNAGSWLLYGYGAVVYLVSMFLATFANVAFYQQIMQALAGQSVSILAGVRFAASRWSSILIWSLFAGLVGLIIKSLEERFGLIGRLVMKFVGVVWSVASVFTIPVIIREGSNNPIVLLRNSATTLRKTWGESLIGYVGIAVGSWVILLGSLVLLGGSVLISVALHTPVVAIAVGVVWLIAMMIFGYVTSVASHVYRCALYVYASEGVIPEPYNAEMMNMAWKVKKA